MLMQSIRHAEVMEWNGKNVKEVREFFNGFKNANIYEDLLGSNCKLDGERSSFKYDLRINNEIVEIGDYLVNEGNDNMHVCKKDDLFKKWSPIISTEHALEEDYDNKNQTTKMREEAKKMFIDDISKDDANFLTFTYDFDSGDCSTCLTNTFPNKYTT